MDRGAAAGRPRAYGELQERYELGLERPEAAMNLIRFAFFALTLLTTGSAAAQSYPDRAIRIIVGFTAGSATDISARMFAQKLNEAWAVPVTVENIAGNGGSIGGE